MNRFLSKMSIILNNFIQVFVVFYLMTAFVDIIKYSGFLEKHILIGPNSVVLIVIVFNLLILVIQKREHYWWQNGFGKIIRGQSFVLTPILWLVYIYFSRLEGVNYPNYVFSTYHLSLMPMFNLLIFEFLILILPNIFDTLKDYLKDLRGGSELK